jgi:hypothetical protein
MYERTLAKNETVKLKFQVKGATATKPVSVTIWALIEAAGAGRPDKAYVVRNFTVNSNAIYETNYPLDGKPGIHKLVMLTWNKGGAAPKITEIDITQLAVEASP